MTDPNAAERAAMDDASDRAAEYIEEHGHDLSQWSRDTWQSFIGCICGGYVNALIENRVTAVEAAGKVSDTHVP